MTLRNDQDLSTFAVYLHPADHPDRVVVREWRIVAGQIEPVTACQLFDTVDDARAYLRAIDLIPIARGEHDDPCLVETWL